MSRLPVVRGLPRRVGPWLLLAFPAWVLGSGVGCRVDETGLGSSPKLSRDAGMPVIATGGNGTGGAQGLGGSASGGSATGGGTGGPVIATGGAGGGQDGAGGDQGGTGGDQGGTGGLAATGGTSGDTGGSTGAGGMAGAPVDATGGTAGAVATGGAGGAAGMSVQGTGGAAGAAGMPGTGGAGTGGSAGAGGRAGTRCTSFNCTGCCNGTVCVTTPSAQQCGTRGAACTTCGACQTCSNAGTCAIDPNSQWTIVAENAKVTTSPPLGSTWDPARGDIGGSAPDLFCEYENPAYDVTPTTAGVTDTVNDVYSASWNETITPAGVTVSASALMAAKPAWRIWVGDQDCSTPTNCTSGQIACSYTQSITSAQLMTGGLSLSNYQNCVSLNVLFQCASPAP